MWSLLVLLYPVYEGSVYLLSHCQWHTCITQEWLLQHSVNLMFKVAWSRKILIFASTCILDPRFKLKWCSDDEEEKNTQRCLFVWHIICNPQVQLMTRHKFAINLSLLPRKGKKPEHFIKFNETVLASCDSWVFNNLWSMGQMAQQWLACLPLGIHLEPIINHN